MTFQLAWKAEDVIRAVRGHYLHEQTWVAHGVAIDSRAVKKGDLFIALKGANHDGHNHVAEAFAAGAAAAVVSRPPQVSAFAPLITVADTAIALEDLGQAGRRRSQAQIIAISGLADTAVNKDMLRLMLNEVGETYASDGVLTERVEVSLALACLPEAALYGLFEIGKPRPGEMALLARQMRPDVVFVTTTESMPQEYFTSTGALADTQAEIFQGMDATGAVVLNRDNPHFAQMAAAARRSGVKTILGFGHEPKADARLLDYAEKPYGGRVEADVLGYALTYNIGTPGLRTALHSLGALCTAAAAGGDPEACAVALSSMRQAGDDGMIHAVPLSDGAFMLINENTDTSLPAMRFAIRVLGQMTPEMGSQRILVLGNIPLPAELARDIADAKIAAVFTCGPVMQPFFEALPPALRGFHAPNSDELIPHVLNTVHPGDVVTIKGGPKAHMDILIDALRRLGNDSWRTQKLAG